MGSGSIESMVKTGGTIPSEIGLFSKLHDQDLNSDDESLHGSIPSQLGMLSGLEHIYITNNNLNGNIPSQLGTLSQLSKTTSMDPSHLQLGNLTQLVGLLFSKQSTSTEPSPLSVWTKFNALISEPTTSTDPSPLSWELYPHCIL